MNATRCNKPLQPVCYERIVNAREGTEVYQLVSPLCSLEWGHEGPCSRGE